MRIGEVVNVKEKDFKDVRVCGHKTVKDEGDYR